MKKNSKLALLIALFAVCLLSQKIEVSAFINSSFGGQTYGNRWSIVDGKSTKKDSKNAPVVTWQYSNRDGHRQWFSIIEEGYSNGVGEAILQFKSNGTINTNRAEVGKKYYLKSKREHFVDPTTYISGVWSPN